MSGVNRPVEIPLLASRRLAAAQSHFSPIPNIRILLFVTGVIYFLAAVTNRVFIMVEEKMPVEGWFIGPLVLLAIPVLAIAYTLWDVYRVTTR
jgi:hypothetical protein